MEALACGRLEHETRSAQDEKNWIVSGRISLEDACSIVAATRGTDAQVVAHHFDPDIELWVFKPQYERQRWYIKGYLVGDEIHLIELRLMSLHPTA